MVDSDNEKFIQRKNHWLKRYPATDRLSAVMMYAEPPIDRSTAKSFTKQTAGSLRSTERILPFNR
jgi:hypothetical protein